MTGRRNEPQHICGNVKYLCPMGKSINILWSRTFFDAVDMRLTVADPLPQQCLADTKPVGTEVVGMVSVRAEYVAHVVSVEGVPKFGSVPEGRRYTRWRDQLISCDALTGAAKRGRIVGSQTSATTTVSRSALAGHRSPLWWLSTPQV